MHDAGIDLVHFSNMRERLEAFYLEPDSHSDSGSNESCNKPVAENSDSKDIRHYSESIPEFLSTHPATENRVLLVERYKREHGLL
ncbi:MAG: hypothetical protein KUG71_15080, partial [Porticoccaceae bacterium]|nr:hypothetical protein [Porticoccaceae bacterium]